MKNRLTIFFLAFFLVLVWSANGATAFAVSTPYAVIGEDVWLLGEAGNKLFLLPETYYARIERMDENYYYVVFNGVSGKIPKGSVSVVGYDRQVKDTQKIIRIGDQFSVFTEIKLKTVIDGEGAEELAIPTSEPLTYVGTYKLGEQIWYYVSYAGLYGYVLNTYTDTPSMGTEKFIPEQDEPEGRESPAEESEEETKPDLVKILVIGGVSAVVLIFVIILFLPRKNKRHKYYYS